MFGLINRGELPGKVELEFENLVTRLRRFVAKEHNTDGTHNIEALNDMAQWVPFYPTWTNVTVGNGTVTARYTRFGKTIAFYVRLVFGSTTAVTGSVFVQVPVTMESSQVFPISVKLADCLYRDASLGQIYWGGGISLDANRVALFNNTSPLQNTNVTVPFTWAVDDALNVSGLYEAAE